jgi:hypothetical protein
MLSLVRSIDIPLGRRRYHFSDYAVAVHEAGHVVAASARLINSFGLLAADGGRFEQYEPCLPALARLIAGNYIRK